MRISQAFFGALLGAALIVPQLVWLSPATAAVYSPQQVLPEPAIRDFLADPGALLKQFPDGGSQMISRVRDLAASDPSTLNAIVGLLATANANQATAIGTGLGQVALMAVKTDQAYANQIQEAIAKAVAANKGRGAAPAGAGQTVVAGAGPGSSQPQIGNAVKTINQVEGATEKGTQPLSSGDDIYVNEVVHTGLASKAEFLFADRTNLSLAPATTVRLDKFIYDPSGGSGSVVVNVSTGTFRFITGVQDARNYEIRTPYATMGVRGTEFVASITSTGEQISVVSGTVTVTVGTTSYTVDAGQTLTISATGVVSGPVPTPANIQTAINDNFADLGTPTTNLTVADALSAFSAATGNTTIGSTGLGGGGAGGGGTGQVTAFGYTGAGGSSGAQSFSTYVVNTPSNSVTLSFTSSTPRTASTTNSVSPH